MMSRWSSLTRARFARASRWRWLQPLAGVVALAALLGGCAQTTAAPVAKATATPTSAPTPTPLPPAPLLWKQVTLPTNASGAAVAVAPSDAATVYACLALPPSGSHIEWPRVWVTHDFAAHWSQMASVPADHVNNGCSITVDQLNPSIAVAVLTWMPNGATSPSTYDNYVTFDGGASWRKLTDSQPFIMSLLTGPATRNGVTYATRDVLTGNAYHNGLWVSSDHMTTWRLIDPPGVTADTATFWLDPTTGELLAQYGEPEQPSDLWDSRDGGAHWTQINAPSLMTPSPSRYPYVAGPSGSPSGWMICSTVVKVTGATAGDPLTCSRDGGKSWDTLPAIAPDTPSDNSSQQVGVVSGIASDGTIVAILPTGSVNELFRLAPGAEQWQSLGDLAPEMCYSRLSSGDVVWSVPSPQSLIIATSHA